MMYSFYNIALQDSDQGQTLKDAQQVPEHVSSQFAMRLSKKACNVPPSSICTLLNVPCQTCLGNADKTKIRLYRFNFEDFLENA